jgi:hypothetical protein
MNRKSWRRRAAVDAPATLLIHPQRLRLELFDSKRAPINPHRLIIMEPLIKGIAGIGFSRANDEFRKKLNGISFHNFKSYRCVVGSQAARKLTAAG